MTEAGCCFSLCLVESPRQFAGLFRRRIAWDDEAIREALGADAVAFVMGRRCRGGEDVGARAPSVDQGWASAQHLSRPCPHAPQDGARCAGRVHIPTAWRREGCRRNLGAPSHNRGVGPRGWSPAGPRPVQPTGVSGHSEPWLRECAQCDGGSWWCGPRSERIGASANSDFHIRGVSSMARLAG